MGKTNKAQRTKGNTRPSSSGHSAQLLSLSGRTINGFIGFDGLEKDKASYVPVTGQQISDSCDSCVDSDFRMVMRKMLKRDAVTRLKAMQEFKEYCVEKDVDAVKNVLPFWPRLFNRLALDCDRRIREATHQANGELISKIKRDFAPYLKSIMGVWLLGQCDLYAPAACAAQATFSTTFPPTKQSDALLHCKTEIFSYYKDNLFEQTAKSMSEPNTTSPEDMENKYILVISGTLQAFKLFLITIDSKDQSDLCDNFYHVVADKKFWKFSKSKESEIRGSWYALISSLCQSMPTIFTEMESKLAASVLGCLSECDPVVAPSIWEAALSVVVNFENCWENVNIHKVVLPQLWSLLKGGGKGNAQVLFPCLLPFLSKLPKDILESEKFLLQFFSSLKQSLFLENVKSSHMECDAVLTAFMECLQYICCVRLDKREVCSTLFEDILINEVIPVIESSLYGDNIHLAASKLYPLLGTLIKKMEFKCQTKQEGSETFSKILNAFWESMMPVLGKAFDLEEKRKSESIMYLSYFFNSLLVPSDVLLKPEKSKVHFEDEENMQDPSLNEQSVACNIKDPHAVFLSNKNSKSFAYLLKFNKLLCEKVDKDTNLYFINLLVEILGSAPTNELFFELISEVTTGKCSNELPIIFSRDFIFKWITQAKNDIAKLNSIAELIFITCSCISEDEALKIMLLCCEESNASLLQCLLNKGLLKHSSSSLFLKWLKTPLFSERVTSGLQNIAKKILTSDFANFKEIKVHLNILNMCLSTNMLEKSPIDNKNMETILLLLNDFTEKLFQLEYESPNMKCGLDFLSDACICILNNSKICWNFKATDDLVSLIFHQTLSSNNAYETLKIIWVTAIESYIRFKSEIVHDNSLILRMASELHSSILSLSSLDMYNTVLNHCFDLLCSIQESLMLQKSKLQYSALFALYKLMDSILPTEQDWYELKEGFNLTTVPLFLQNHLFYPLFVEESFYPCGSIENMFLVTHISTQIIKKELQRTNSFADYKFFESYITKHFPHILWFATFFEKTSAANMLSEELFSIKLSEDGLNMLTFLRNGISDIVNEIIESSLFYGTFWAVPLQFLIEKYKENNQSKEIPILIEEMLQKVNSTENLNKYILQQIAIPFLSNETQLNRFVKTVLEIFAIEELSNENFAGKLGEICCYLENNNLEIIDTMQNCLKDIIYAVIDYEFEDENLKFAYDLQVTALFSSLTNHGLYITDKKILDYFITSMKDFLQKRSSADLNNPTVALKLYNTFTIFIALSNVCSFNTDEENNVKLSFLDEDFYVNFISMYIYAANVFSQMKPLPEICSNILLKLSDAMKLLPSELLVKNIDTPIEVIEGKSATIFESLISSLTFTSQQIQLISHSLLLKIMRSLPDLLLGMEKNQEEDDKEEDIEKIPANLSPLIKLLAFLTEIVENMLLEFKIGDLCLVMPQTDAYVYTMAYLLSSIEMLEFISSSPSQIRSSYAADLENKKLLSELFSNLFRLMPSNPILCLKKGLNLDTPKKEDLKLLFTQPPVLNSDGLSSEDIQCVASYVYATVLRQLPASIRTWWNNLDRKSADIVNKFTTKYISGFLCVEEIQAVHESEKQFENMMVQARPGSREVIATYSIDDCSIELSVQLPINYPLGPISAERRGKAVIGQLEWRHWLMQLTTVLRYQNGSILDGLNIWKRNLDKKFEGVEECMICYYILHSSTSKLPKLSCRVCKKKFHSFCLYKWFETSYNSTCPLCRNEFFVLPKT